jgi:hypothetical protein
MAFFGLLKGLISDTESVDLRADASTHSLQVVDYAHHEIHSGSSYHTNFSNLTANTDAHRTAIGFVTSATAKWVHMTISASSSLEAEVYILEAPTINNDTGTQKAVYNRNRNSVYTSLVTDVSAAPTAATVETYIEAELATLAGGTELEHFNMAAGSGNQALGGDARGQAEWVLDAGVLYLVIVENIGANLNLHEIHLNWYEHTDKS